MAQLPPRVPTLTPNWSEFSHHKMLFPENLEPSAPNIPDSAWSNNFFDFSPAKRGSHRRSVSHSVAFLDDPMADGAGSPSAAAAPLLPASFDAEFDRFDEEQLMSMFANEDVVMMTVGPIAVNSNPSTSSTDRNSINDEKQGAPSDQQLIRGECDEEAQSSCKLEGQAAQFHAAPSSSGADKITDPKRVKRILANRQSAQRSRVRKLQYISELERSVTSLQAEVSVLSPRVQFLDHQRLVLNSDNNALKQRIAALTQDKLFKESHQEALKREIERLRQVYCQQNLKKMENAKQASQPPSASDVNGSSQEERLLS